MASSPTPKGRRPDRPRHVLFPLNPKPGESLPGYIARTAAWNFLEETSVLLKLGGVAFTGRGDLSAPVRSVSGSLAEVLGISETQLRALAYEGGGEAALIDFHGAQLRQHQIDHNRRRVAPGALKVSAHHRALWSVRALPFCSETWELLIDHCHVPACGKPLRWRRAAGIDVCEHCEADLKLAPATCVPLDDRMSLDFMAGLLSPIAGRRQHALECAPKELLHLGAGGLFELALSFGLASSPAEFLTSQGAQARPIYWRTLIGGRMLLGYPRTIEAVAATGSIENATMPTFFRQLRRQDHSTIPNVMEAVSSLVDKYEGGERRGVVRLKRRRQSQGALTLVETARKLKIGNQAVRALVERGILEAGAARGEHRRLQWLEVPDVDIVATALRGRVSRQAFAAAYGIPSKVLDQLVSAGHLRASTAPAVEVAYSKLQLDKASCDAFVGALGAVLLSDVKEARNRVPIGQTMGSLAPGQDAWLPIISAALGNQLPGGIYSPNGVVNFRRFHITTDVHLCLMLGSLRDDVLNERHPVASSTVELDMRRSEAEDHLRCPPNDFSILVRLGLVTCLGGKPSMYSRADVEAFGASHISTREMSYRTGIRTHFIGPIAIMMGMVRVMGSFWYRRDFNDRALAMLSFPAEKRMRIWKPSAASLSEASKLHLTAA